MDVPAHSKKKTTKFRSSFYWIKELKIYRKIKKLKTLLPKPESTLSNFCFGPNTSPLQHTDQEANPHFLFSKASEVLFIFHPDSTSREVIII